MNNQALAPSIDRLSFAGLPHTPAEHFKLYFYAAVLHLLLHAAEYIGDTIPGKHSLQEAVFSRFPFLTGYINELAEFGLEGMSLAQGEEQWRLAIEAWEMAAKPALPLTALCKAAGLDYDAIILLMTVGLIEEDSRFGPLVAALQSMVGQNRPTLALLSAWWREPNGYGEVRRTVGRLLELGLLEVINHEAPRLEWAFQPGSLLWDALRGERHPDPAAWCRYIPVEELHCLEDLVLPADLRHSLQILPGLLLSGEVQAVVVRGAQHDGRCTLLGAIACQMGRGLLVIDELSSHGEDDNAYRKRWHKVGPLATLLQALPVAVFDLSPGENSELPTLEGYKGPLCVVMGRQGGLMGTGVERAFPLTLEMPDRVARRQLWQHSLGEAVLPPDLDIISERLRLTRGNLQRVADLARAYAALADHPTVTLADVQKASRALNRQVLETLAQRIETGADWVQLSVTADTRHELLSLENCCRYREALPERVGAAFGRSLNCGVRALFSGPSGTGKTLAAGLLAAVLQMDLYRLDLASVVNKYIGETEKNLNQVFTRAEELDVILLLDEGDALLTQRTSVNTANDRYANLETSYLLQRIETYQGILIITTNASDRIDNAFKRRMDVVVEFRPPDAVERFAIWQSHLPAGHAIEDRYLHEVANHCHLTGAQIRNAVLHASLLALDGHLTAGNGNSATPDGRITAACLEAALQREYRKMGAVYPLQPYFTITG